MKKVSNQNLTRYIIILTFQRHIASFLCIFYPRRLLHDVGTFVWYPAYTFTKLETPSSVPRKKNIKNCFQNEFFKRLSICECLLFIKPFISFAVLTAASQRFHYSSFKEKMCKTPRYARNLHLNSFRRLKYLDSLQRY